MKRLFLIDGHGLAYRAFFAIKGLSNSRGEPTNAVYGFTTILLKLIREENPQYLAIAFDSDKPTFRHALYPEYKAHRERMPTELRFQIPIIRRLVSAFNIPWFCKDGYEADDLLGTMTRSMRDEVDEVIIVTGDKDMLQLVSPNVKILTTKHGLSEIVSYDEKKVVERFGVPPSLVVDVLGLSGDSSDNVPGVPGVGEKTAIKYVQEFGTIDNLFSNLHKLSSEKQRANLLQSKEQAYLSKKLVTIDQDVPMDITIDACQFKGYNEDNLSEILNELEFFTILKGLKMKQIISTTSYEVITTEEAFQSLLDTIRQKEAFSIDLETTGTNPMTAEIVGIAISYESGAGFYIPIQHHYLGVPYQLPKEVVLEGLHPLLSDVRIKKYGQNLKYELILFVRNGIELKGMAFDTMIASYLVNPEGRHNLEELALRYLKISKESYKDVVGKHEGFWEVEIERAAQYAGGDADTTYRLVEPLKNMLEERELTELYDNIELPLVEVLTQMEMNGIGIDYKYLQQISVQLKDALEKVQDEIYASAGERFNINSPKQLSFILFDRLQLPVIKRIKTGISTNEEVLEQLWPYHDLPKKILEYRELMKLKSTYVDALSELINPITGRIHTSYNQAVTATGRLSSSAPNLQNIPTKTELGYKIRKAFVPTEELDILLWADYSQIELRLLAHISHDETLIAAFINDEDIHTRTAQEIFLIPAEDITPVQRRIAKIVNFGVTYGMSPYGLSKELHISVTEAREFITNYFGRYKGVKAYLERQIEEARTNGYVSTLWGRRRYLQDINSSNKQLREFAERAAINAPIQGSAADLIKIAMLALHRRLLDKPEIKMVLQVHDELVFELPKAYLEETKKVVKECMEGAAKLDLPIKVDMQWGENWGTGKEGSSV